MAGLLNPDVTVEVVGTKELDAFLGQLHERYYKGARRAFSKAVLNAHRKILTHFGNDEQGLLLRSRTGNLMRSIFPEVTGESLENLAGRVYSVSKYARLQEKGGTVKAKNKYIGVPGGPYLNIPLDPNKTAAGVQRQTAGMVFAAGGFVSKGRPDSKTGQLVHGGSTGPWYVFSHQDEAMFILVKQAYIPPRLGMVETTVGEVATLMEEMKNLDLDEPV